MILVFPIINEQQKNLLVIIQEMRCQGEEDCNPETTGLTCVKGSCVCPFYQVDTIIVIVNFHPLREAVIYVLTDFVR